MKNTDKQYTLRNIPLDLDKVLRKRAKDRGMSFNQTALDALIVGAGLQIKPKRDFTGVIGSLSEQDCLQLETEIKSQHQIDRKIWE